MICAAAARSSAGREALHLHLFVLRSQQQAEKERQVGMDLGVLFLLSLMILVNIPDH